MTEEKMKTANTPDRNLRRENIILNEEEKNEEKMRKKVRHMLSRCTSILSSFFHRTRYELLENEEGERNDEIKPEVRRPSTVRNTAGPEDVSDFWCQATLPRHRERRGGKCEQDLQREFAELKQILRLSMLREYNLI